MSVSELLEPDPNEPLALAAFARPAPGAYADHRCLALEFSSRGDRVLGQLVMPDAPSPPLIVLAHGLGSSRNQDGMDAIGARWVREGAAVASIDFALHGERAAEVARPSCLASRIAVSHMETGVCNAIT